MKEIITEIELKFETTTKYKLYLKDSSGYAISPSAYNTIERAKEMGNYMMDKGYTVSKIVKVETSRLV